MFAEYWDIGQPIYECEYCGALLWKEERSDKAHNTNNPKFTLCCMKGKVQLPLMKRPPDILEKLMSRTTPMSNRFMKNIRVYNNMFSFTSMGGKIDHTVNNGQGPYVFRLGGQNMHFMGSLLPMPGNVPRFSQIYIYDTDNEVSNRMSTSR